MEKNTAVSNNCNYTVHISNYTEWEEEKIEDPHLLYIIFTPILILLCMFTIIFNIILLLSTIWIKRPLSPTLYISISLAGTDLYTSFLLGLSFTVNSLLPEGFQINLMTNCMSLVLEALRLGAIVTTAGHLLFLAFNHYIGILRPLHYSATVTHGMVTIFIFFLWTLPPSFLLAYFNMIPCQAFQTPQCAYGFLLESKFRSAFTVVLFGALLTMGIIYYHILIIVKKHQATRLQYKRSVHYNRSSKVNCSDQSESQQSKNEKAVYTTLMIVGSVVVGWMPACIQYYLICNDCVIQPNWASLRVRFYTYFATNCLVILKSAINSYIYAARMKDIQVAMHKMYFYINQKICGESNEMDNSIEFDEFKYSRSSAKSRKTVICRMSIRRNDCSEQDQQRVNENNIDNEVVFKNKNTFPMHHEQFDKVTHL
ncbi:trace amine-associated receptor 4-like [Adelges cooleyi]|uniref:trace amine-associated receptor 4-like n=1 Tax=Adelges cooleyi TaxID=133065 RepID=UPI00217FE8F7|nr:trace amine-associated receptor 4-like [Adelges cooleyi]XP_050432468.1 trace amine-associated receptor 4-like [Adelges cooleyi]XP_050432469.1 trace amine-associated receptor 4-like [Adelges cooleyi]XP_050432470.1 trace amine-associated receptor 4-like [Adelges cooleyi]